MLGAAVAVLCLLAPAVARAGVPSTERDSVSSAAGEANGGSSHAVVSADGRWVAFQSDATNLVASDTDGVTDVFLHDRQSGQTVRVSVGPGGAQGNGASTRPVMSDDGRYVAFLSNASTLVPGITGPAIYRYDRVTRQLLAVPDPSGYHDPVALAISADGSRLAFEDIAAGRSDIFWWNAATDGVARVTETNDGTPANGGDSFNGFDPAISGDGNWVGFTTDATNLLAPPLTDTNGFRDVYERNLSTGVFTRISVGSGFPGAEANLHSSTPAIDGDGCVVAFHSSATNLVTGDPGGTTRNFVRDRCAGTTEDVSISNAGTPGPADAPLGISSDGCKVVYLAAAVASPPAAMGDAVVQRDRCLGVTSRLDLATSGDPGDQGAGDVSISGGTGRYVAFSTNATNLVGADGNALEDVFVRDEATNTPPSAVLHVAATGATVTADATGSSDPDGFVLSSAIAYGDGAAAAGLSGTHTYAQPGTYAVSVTVTDADGAAATATQAVTIAPGSSGPPPGTPGPPSTKPKAPSRVALSRVALSRRRFAAVAAGGHADRRHGSALHLQLSRAATVTLHFQRELLGHRAKHRCRAGARGGPRCTILAAAGTLTRALKPGSATIALSGRIGRSTLAAGRYRLTVSARAGGHSATRRLTFVVLRPTPRKVS